MCNNHTYIYIYFTHVQYTYSFAHFLYLKKTKHLSFSCVVLLLLHRLIQITLLEHLFLLL